MKRWEPLLWMMVGSVLLRISLNDIPVLWQHVTLVLGVGLISLATALDITGGKR